MMTDLIVDVLVMTDGRSDCISQSLASIDRLKGAHLVVTIHDDSGDPEYTRWLVEQFEPFPTNAYVIATPCRSGFGGAIRSAWGYLSAPETQTHWVPGDWVFHLEDDFVLRRDVDLAAMVRVLDANPNLVQLALRRQPWNDAEKAAGGIVEQHADAYQDMVMGKTPDRWLEHRLFFTTNPSLYRRSLCLREWPEGGNSEGHFTHQLLVDSSVRFGFWGARDSGEWVEHIGHARVGTGY